MVNRFAIAAPLFAMLATPVVASTGMPAIVGITIDRNGARSNGVSGDETVAFCRRFRLSTAEVRGYFRQADPVDAQAFHHDLDMSRCQAAGRIRFAGGRRGLWTIDLARRGSLVMAGRPTRYFYCLSCKSRRFDPLDAETADAARDMIRRAATKR